MQVHVFQMISFLEAAEKAMLSCGDFVNNILRKREGSGPKEIGKEAEADLAREIDSQAACIVNGDGTVVDNKRPSDLPLSDVPSSKGGTPEESNTLLDIEPSWTMDPKNLQQPHIRDGTSVNM